VNNGVIAPLAEIQLVDPGCAGVGLALAIIIAIICSHRWAHLFLKRLRTQWTSAHATVRFTAITVAFAGAVSALLQAAPPLLMWGIGLLYAAGTSRKHIWRWAGVISCRVVSLRRDAHRRVARAGGDCCSSAGGRRPPHRRSCMSVGRHWLSSRPQ
jgi:hypothetical protein